MTGDEPDDGLQAAIDGELRLLQRQTRQSAPEIDVLLDPEFLEFGASGRRLSRDEIISALLTEEGDSIAARDVKAVRVAGGVVLVTYVTDQGDRRCNRSSIWRLTPAGWRCFFHQGSLIPSENWVFNSACRAWIDSQFR